VFIALALAALVGCARRGPVPTVAPTTAATEMPASLAAASHTPPAATATATLSIPEPSPTAAPRLVTIGLAAPPQTLDPAGAADQAALLITRHLYDSLLAFEAGTTRVIPALAESWQASSDGLSWTFHLRSNVSFSDGTPFNADAARLNIERWLHGAPPGNYLFWRVLFGGFDGEAGADGEPLSLVAGVQAPDPQTLVLSLHRPDASLLNSLAMSSFAMVSPAVLEHPDRAALLNSTSAGTGPFQLPAGGAATGELIRLQRVSGHWNTALDALGPDELILKVIPDDAQRLLALQTGEVELISAINPRDYAAAGAPGAGTRLLFNPPLNVLYLGFNQARAPWHNLDCRLAVAHAINRPRYVAEFFPGDAIVAAAMQPASVWGYPEALRGLDFDPGLAREHLQACLDAGLGLAPGATLYVPPLERAYLPQPEALGLAIQADLAAVGISVTVTSPAWESTWLPDVYNGRADLFLLGWSGINGDPDSFLCPLFCGLDSRFNSDLRGLPLPADEQLAELLVAARGLSDPASREALYQQAHERFFEALPAIPMAHRQAAMAMRSNLTGYVASPVESLYFNLRLGP
jgi:peptide/nickel transport system substrate-binding protein